MSLDVRTSSGPEGGVEHRLSDPECGLVAFLAFGEKERPRAFGGVRRKLYRDEGEALADARRLARDMQLKLTCAGTGAGGAKAVILDHGALDRVGAYRAFGRFVEGLDGRYVCGPDVGTNDEDLKLVREETAFVNHPDNDAGESTARGVVAGCLTTLAALEIEPTRAVAVVQGVGAVGEKVARRLAHLGVRLTVADLDGARAERLARELGGTAIDAASELLAVPCDLLVPCALGEIVSRGDVKRVRARAICGSANAQLDRLETARALDHEGVLWAPDFIVNAGAVVEGVLAHGRRRQDVADDVDRALDAIGGRLARVFTEARERRTTPVDVALEWAEDRS